MFAEVKVQKNLKSMVNMW